MRRRFIGTVAFLATVLLAHVFLAGVLAAQNTQTVLTVAPMDAGGPARTFTMTQLLALPQAEIRTANEFIDGTRVFRGPTILDVLRASGGANARSVRMIALNDYEIQVDTSEFRKYDPILALTMDGEALSVRDKGPIWMIYPMSDFPELRDPVYNSRLIWQLTRIEYR